MDVKKSFGAEEVLHGITREFEPGKIHGIVGNNGSGKTVLMKCICGFLRPTSGKVLVDGKEVGKDMDFPENLPWETKTASWTDFKNCANKQ